MKKKRIIGIIILLMIISFMITDRIRFSNGKYPIFAIPSIGISDGSFYFTYK